MFDPVPIPDRIAADHAATCTGWLDLLRFAGRRSAADGNRKWQTHEQGPSSRRRQATIGAVKQTVGKLVGDAKLQTDGKLEQLEGTLQNAVGSAKDTVKR